jgi:hypothetical protein
MLLIHYLPYSVLGIVCALTKTMSIHSAMKAPHFTEKITDEGLVGAYNRFVFLSNVLRRHSQRSPLMSCPGCSLINSLAPHPLAPDTSWICFFDDVTYLLSTNVMSSTRVHLLRYSGVQDALKDPRLKTVADCLIACEVFGNTYSGLECLMS